jgi:hypothetical protein
MTTDVVAQLEEGPRTGEEPVQGKRKHMASLLRDIVQKFIDAELMSDRHSVPLNHLKTRLKEFDPKNTEAIDTIYSWCSKTKTPSVKKLLQDHHFSFDDRDLSNTHLVYAKHGNMP